MRSPIGRRSAGVLVAALAVAGGVVGMSPAGSDEAAGEQVIRLTYGDLVAEESYLLEDGRGEPSAVIDLFKGRLHDVDGNVVGTHRCECINATAAGYGWTCTHIFSLRPGPTTERGTVVLIGNFRGFDGEQAAITGGTGAYAGARGYAVATADGEGFHHTIHLIP